MCVRRACVCVCDDSCINTSPQRDSEKLTLFISLRKCSLIHPQAYILASDVALQNVKCKQCKIFWGHFIDINNNDTRMLIQADMKHTSQMPHCFSDGLIFNLYSKLNFLSKRM